MCRILGEKCMFKPRSSKDGTCFNLVSPLETKRFTPKVNLNCHKYFKNGTFSSQHRCGCHNSLFAGNCSRKSYASG